MIYTQMDLLKTKRYDIDETITFDKKLIDNASLVKEVLPTKIKGVIKYNIDADILNIDVDIESKVIALSSVGLSEVTMDINTKLEREYSFDQNNKTLDILVKKEFNLAAEIYNEILFNIPMKIESKNDKIIKQGANWALMTEDELADSALEDIDPRFAKLKEYMDKK